MTDATLTRGSNRDAYSQGRTEALGTLFSSLMAVAKDQDAAEEFLTLWQELRQAGTDAERNEIVVTIRERLVPETMLVEMDRSFDLSHKDPAVRQRVSIVVSTYYHSARPAGSAQQKVLHSPAGWHALSLAKGVAELDGDA